MRCRDHEVSRYEQRNPYQQEEVTDGHRGSASGK
jgi:hypothetical protein